MNVPQVKNSIHPLELTRLLAAAEPVRLLDVRTPAEFASVHVPGARLIPLAELTAESLPAPWRDAHAPLFVLCQTGGRARQAIEKLEKAGLTSGVLVEGGTQGWIDAGLPVVRGTTRVFPLMRQVQITVGLLSAAGAVLALAVHPLFAIIPLVLGCGLLFAGLSGTCGLALLLAKMPWNRAPRGAACCQTKEGASL